MNPKRKASIPESPKSIYSSIVETTTNNVNRALKKGKRQLEKIVNLSNSNNDVPSEILIQKIDSQVNSVPISIYE
jgi:hypothetical protein